MSSRPASRGLGRSSSVLVVDENENEIDERQMTLAERLGNGRDKPTSTQRQRPQSSTGLGLSRARSQQMLRNNQFVSPAMISQSMSNSRSGYLFGELVNNTVRYKNPKDTAMGGFMQSASGYSKMLDRDEHNDAIPFASAPRFDFTTTIANHSPGPIYYADNLVSKAAAPKYSFRGGNEGRSSFAFGSIEKGLLYPGSSESQSTSDLVSPSSYNPQNTNNARLRRPASANWSSSRTKRFLKVRSELELVPGPKYFSSFRKQKNTSVSFGPKKVLRKTRTIRPTGGTKFNVPSMLLRKKKHGYSRGSYEALRQNTVPSVRGVLKERKEKREHEDHEAPEPSKNKKSTKKPLRVGSMAQVYIKPKAVREIERILKRTTFSQRLPLSAWHGKRMAKHQVGNNSPGPIYLVPTDNWKCKQAPPKRTFDGVVVPSWR